jgi:Protein of unknown function (DUF4038)/Putative collagen-binding domain of a collagenase
MSYRPRGLAAFRILLAFTLLLYLSLAAYALNDSSGTAIAAPAYPVKRGPTSRYLVDQNGVPFLIAGESPQAMIGNLSEADAELFFQNRRAHGFNTVWINLLCASGTACRADGKTFDGIAPFTALLNSSSVDSSCGDSPVPNYDISKPNEDYFARADRILQLAAKYGFLVILDPAETRSWLGLLRSNGVNRSRAYGQFLGKRYVSFHNLLWMSGNDYHCSSPPTADDDQYTTAVVLGIKDFDNRHIHTVGLYYLVSSSLDDERWAPLIDLNASYTYFPTYQQVLTDYNRPNFLPTFMVEASYEFEQLFNSDPAVPPPGIPRVLRRQEYWSLLSGATGQLYGNKYTWQFIAGWQSQLDTPGAVQMKHVTDLFEPRRWYDLVPDQSNTVVTAGIGTFGGLDYVTAARTPDGELVMAYVPSARTLTVDMSKLSGPVTARWYDPTVGTFTNISGSPFANTGSHNFTTPGANAGGDGDWVLVLEVSITPVTSLAAAVLPSSRSVQVGTAATAFATIINVGSSTAAACGISPVTSIPATFSYQATDPATNQVIGSPNTPVDIAAGAARSFIVGLTPTATIAPTDVQLSFDCTNTNPAPINTGLNTLLLSASSSPVPDIVALAATLTNDGIANIPGTNGIGIFAVATVNVGATGTITASADTGSTSLPVNISLCQTNPATGQCISAIDGSVTTTIAAGATPTFGIFMQGNRNVSFDPAANRIFVRFKDSGAVTRGSTSVAVRTQ